MKEYIKKRVLYKNIKRSGEIFEGNVINVSPNGDLIKINGSWDEIKDIRIMDILGDADLTEMMRYM